MNCDVVACCHLHSINKEPTAAVVSHRVQKAHKGGFRRRPRGMAHACIFVKLNWQCDLHTVMGPRVVVGFRVSLRNTVEELLEFCFFPLLVFFFPSSFTPSFPSDLHSFFLLLCFSLSWTQMHDPPASASEYQDYTHI